MKKIGQLYGSPENLEKFRLMTEPYFANFDLSKPREKRRSQELIDTAQFLITYSNDWNILAKLEEPDFVIGDGDTSIGLEHSAILNEELIRKTGSINDLFVHAQNKLRELYVDLNFFANVYILNSYNPNKKDIQGDIEEICVVIMKYVIDGTLIESKIIERISIMSHDRISLSPNNGAWWQKPITSDQVIMAISIKEKLIQKYIANTNLPQWLLLVIGHSGDYSFSVFGDLQIDTNSSFDKIFLFDLSSLILFEIK